MAARCPDCDRALAPVEVPPDLQPFAPDEAAVVGSCPRCLRTLSLDDVDSASGGDDAELPESIPDGEGGAAVVLLLGHLDSLATNRQAIESLVDHAERSGTDVFLTVDRLADEESVAAHVDLARRRRQLESLLDY